MRFLQGLLVLTLCFSVLGFIQNKNDVCNDHPRIICSSISAAIKCDKILYCVTKIWWKSKGNIVTTPQKKLLSCSNCHALMNNFAEKLEAMQIKDFTENLLKLCVQTSRYSEICHKAVAEYRHQIHNIIKSTLRSYSICNNSEFCNGNPEAPSVDSSHDVGDVVECDICKLLIMNFKYFVIPKKPAFKEYLDHFCTETQESQLECLNVTSNTYDAIFEGLIHLLDERRICYGLRFCTRKPTKADEGFSEDYIIFYEEKLKYILSQNFDINNAGGSVVPEVFIKNKALCSLCEYFHRYIHETTPIKEIWSLVINKVCKKHCENIARDKIPLKIYSNSIPIPTAKGLNGCPLCIDAVEEVHGLIRSDLIKEKFEELLEIVCISVDHNLEGHCTEIISHFYEEFHHLIDIFTPKKVCKLLDLCEENEFNHNELKIYSLNNKTMKDEFYGNSNQYDILMSDRKAHQACVVLMGHYNKYLKLQHYQDWITKIWRTSCSSIYPDNKDLYEKCLVYEAQVVHLILYFVTQQFPLQLLCDIFRY